MPSRCSLCRAEGHNIRTCQDPSINDELMNLFSDWIAEDLVFGELETMTEEYRPVLKRHIREHLSVPLIRAIGIQYGRQGRINVPLDVHLSSIVDVIFKEAERVIRFSPQQKEEWCQLVTGMSMNEYLSLREDMLDDYYGEPDGVIEEDKSPAYEIILKSVSGEVDTMLDCAVCQEENPASRFHKTQCSHSFCHDCISTHLTVKRFHRAKCPLCRADIISLEATDLQCYDSLYCNFSEIGALMKDCEKLWNL
jgi:hypothetical protein